MKSSSIEFSNNNCECRRGKYFHFSHRKYKLFGENREIAQPKYPEMSTFTTDFNVTFGHFTSYEILYQSPALDLVALGIRNIIFPSKWLSELPFLTSVQLQQHWAYSTNVNLLAAGVNDPSNGYCGSGIYSGKSGALTSMMSGIKTTRLLVHDVPKMPGNGLDTASSSAYSGLWIDDIKLKRDPLDGYKFRKIILPESMNKTLNESFTLCHGSRDHELCCNFAISVSLRYVTKNSVSRHLTAVSSLQKH